MVLESPVAPYFVWLQASVTPFLMTVLFVFGIGVVLGFLIATLRHGPVAGFRMTVSTLSTAFRELAQTSWRRTFAIARLAFQESIRRRVLTVFVLFVIALLFGGWFLDRDSDHPARLYLSFVLTTTNYLVLFLAIFLSVFSLPNDLKYKTIFTIVTKPVRGWEIVFGRIVGFCAINTLLLAAMCLFSYFFVTRGLHHTHRVTELPDATSGVASESSLDRTHRHDIRLDEEGNLVVGARRDHTHSVTATPDDTPDGSYSLGRTQGLLLARVPIMGDLTYLDRSGNEQLEEGGTNVGYEWDYRKYVEGGTLAAAIWRFDGLRGEDFGDFIPLEMTLRVFRTYKGDIEQGVRGTIELVKPAERGPDGRRITPDGGVRSVEMSFTVREYEAYQPRIPRRILVRDGSGTEREVDVFEELVDPETGALEVWIRCLDREQYLGMAPADLYLRASNRPFWLNFVKAYVTMWLQMVIVTCYGVAFSTFVSGPVALLATGGGGFVGRFKQFVFEVATGEVKGGGPIESFVRIIKQEGQLTELEPGLGTTTIRMVDQVLMLFQQGITNVVPNILEFNTSNYVAYGFDIPGRLVGQYLTVTFAYVVVVTAVGYFLFKTREIAA